MGRKAGLYALATTVIVGATFAAGWWTGRAPTDAAVTLDRFLATIHAQPEAGRLCVRPVDAQDLERVGEVCGLFAQQPDVQVRAGEAVLVEWISWTGTENESAFDVLHLTSP